MPTFVVPKPDNGIGFAGAGLTVGKQGAVIALPRVVQNASAEVVEHFSLKLNTFSSCFTNQILDKGSEFLHMRG